MQNHHVVETAGALMNGRLYSARNRRHRKFGVGFTTLGKIARIGPTHDLIGHLRGKGRRGAFTFDAIGGNPFPTYPALWAASSQTQTAMLVTPTHDGAPTRTDAGDEHGERLLRLMIEQRSDLFISRNLRMTSQALAAARTTEEVMGGRAWTALSIDDEAVRDALTIWLNSTLGLVTRVCYAQTTQPGRATMQIRALGGLPVPDVAGEGPEGDHARKVARENFDELATLRLEPVSYAFRDGNRHKIDKVALEMLGLGEDDEVAQSIDFLRNVWCREPSVHGGSKAVKAALGV